MDRIELSNGNIILLDPVEEHLESLDLGCLGVYPTEEQLEEGESNEGDV